MIPVTRWQELLGWSPPAIAGKEARRVRFGALFEQYRTFFSQPLPFVVKIAGTSGKGSVSAMLEAALLMDGQRVGLFTSPHLVDFTERIRINGCDITTIELDRLAQKTYPFFEMVVEQLGAEYRPTFFEALLFLGLRAFADHGVDVAILEAGVGGYNDVVSLIPGRLSIITSIGLDHIDELGPDLTQIAADKAGIASPDSCLVLGPNLDPNAEATIQQDAARRGVLLSRANRREFTVSSSGMGGHDICFETPSPCFNLTLPLAGNFQLDNFATALEALRKLVENGAAGDVLSIKGVENTRWPARLEVLQGEPIWILDAGHNVLAFNAIRDFAEKYFHSRRCLLVFGTSEPTKAIEGLRLLGPLFSQVYLVDGFYRSAAVSEYSRTITDSVRRFRTCGSPLEAVNRAFEEFSEADNAILVCGSVFLAGACRELLLARGYSPHKGANL